MVEQKNTPQTIPPPDPAFKRFEKLIGKWELKGRTLDSKEDNIFGWTTFEWMSGGFFIKSEGEIDFKGLKIQATEIISYDPKKKVFPANVYSSMYGSVLQYEWDIQGNNVIHKGVGHTYRGTLSEDGNVLTGGWRPDKGTPVREESAYDSVMVRVK